MASRIVLHRFSSKTLSQAGFDKICANRRWLQSAVSGFSPNRTATGQLTPHVLLYGSAVSGTAFRDGDADFAVVFVESASPVGTSENVRESIAEMKRERQEVVLADLFQHIKKSAPDESLKPQRIFHARIPIVQYLRRTGDEETLKFDISLSLEGVKNSLLLRRYMERYPRLHLGVMCVKQWGRETKILNARRGWISPYALTIMYIHFMAVTGRVEELIDEKTVEDHVHQILTAAAGAPERLDGVPEFSTVLQVTGADVDTVQRDVESFFSFYGNPSSFDFDASVVDIRKNGAMLTKEEWLSSVSDLSQVDRWHLLGHENIMLRDPYEPHNLGRSVDFFRGEAIREAFRVAGIKKEPLTFLSTP